jgi:prophage regulatory protein
MQDSTIPEIYSARDCADKIGVSVRTFHTMVSKGLFPKPLQLSGRRVGWPSTDIVKFFDEKLAQREREKVS